MYDDNFLKKTLSKAFESEEFFYVPKGITRYDYRNMHGWWVRVTRDKAQFQKLFYDSQFGSIQEALKNAILYRHEILVNFPITIKKISNRGLPLEAEKRITRRKDKGKLRPYIYWQARWYDKNHTVKFKSFPVYTLGEEVAKSKALEAAEKNHNKKPKLTKVTDLYLQDEFDPLERADIEIYATIDSKPSNNEEYNKSITANDPFYYEGEKKLEIHKSIERNRKLRSSKVSSFLEEHGKLFCELCQFSFKEQYPFLMVDIIEVHHIVPLSTLKKASIVKLSDLMLLCSNCHFAIHQGDAEENLLLAMDHFEAINEKQDKLP